MVCPYCDRADGQFCKRKTKEELAYYAYALVIWVVVFVTIKAIFRF